MRNISARFLPAMLLLIVASGCNLLNQTEANSRAAPGTVSPLTKNYLMLEAGYEDALTVKGIATAAGKVSAQEAADFEVWRGLYVVTVLNPAGVAAQQGTPPMPASDYQATVSKRQIIENVWASQSRPVIAAPPAGGG